MFTATDLDAFTMYITPEDQCLPQALADFMAGAKESIDFVQYGCTLDQFYAGVTDAYKRGVKVTGVFDHTQACGPAEAQKLHALYIATDPDCYRIGTSEKHHQIVHMKAVWRDGKDLWFGSWNSSPSASEQSNYVCVLTDVPQVVAHFDA